MQQRVKRSGRRNGKADLPAPQTQCSIDVMSASGRKAVLDHALALGGAGQITAHDVSLLEAAFSVGDLSAIPPELWNKLGLGGVHPGSPRPLSDHLRTYLQHRLSEAETALQELGVPAHIWKRFDVIFADKMPVFGDDPVLESLLGPRFPRSNSASELLPSTHNTARDSLDKRSRELKQALNRPWRDEGRRSSEETVAVPDVLIDLVAKDQVLKGDQSLRAWHEQDGNRIPPLFRETPRWHWAKTAAVAAHALKWADDPAVMFVAGAFLERQQIINAIVAEMAVGMARQALRQGRSGLSRKRIAEYKARTEPLHRLIRERAARYPSARKAAAELVRDRAIQAQAKELRGKPYTERALRQIIAGK